MATLARLSTVLLALALLASAPRVGARQQAPGSFRTRIEVVPVDVRVIDRDGKPVTDLKQEDFIVLEDGVRQQIRHFSIQSFAAQTGEAIVPGEKPMLRKLPKLELLPQKGRVFLLVLGRGRLNVPSKALDGATRFVRERLLPQDYVAVLAYNRATDFSRDHEKVAEVLDRFKRRHESIEAKLSSLQGGLAAVYGSARLPAVLQGEIDAIFKGPGALPTRDVPSGGANQDARKVQQDQERGTNAMLRLGALPPEARADPSTTFDQLVADAYTDLPFDEYVSRNLETMQDLGNIQAGIEYLRYLEGEKHLVFFSERGLYFPRTENDRNLAALASDARVVIDTIQTGGLPAAPATLTSMPVGGPGGRGVNAPLPLPGPTFSDRFAIASMRNVSQMTGGVSSAYEYTDKALQRIDDTTRVEYLLGYYPTNRNWDSRYRRIAVRVNRPGVTVLFRHGYYGSTMVVPVDHRAFMTYRRVAAAGSYDREVKDIGLKVNASIVRNEARIAQRVAITTTVDLSKIQFKPVEDRAVATIQLAYFCADDHERMLGEKWQTLDLALRDDSYQRMLKEGAQYTLDLAVTGEPHYLKVIAYNYETDLIGSVIVKLPK